ncbi:MAG: PAS domain S-box protein, partial [Thermodesulfobacteriota bacterium]|nr:PAS domain S-box protein [Thermodesulfobacteriota bacterium]
FLELDDYTEVFKAVEENRADAGITNRNFGNKNAKNFNLKKTPILFQPINMKFAFPKDAGSTPYLSERINYHIKQLKQDENSLYYRLLEKYFETEIAEKTVEIFPGWLGTTLKIIAALFIFFVLVIIASRIQVKRKTSEILAGRETLQASEERYRSVFENTGTATVILEEDTTISMANTEFEKLSGYSREEIEGREKWTEFVVKEDLERMRGYAAERRKNGGKAPTEYEFRFDNKRNSIKDIFLKVGMIPGTKKNVASLMDITARKQAEEKINHLNLVLSAIRNVNQLIVTEKDRGRLIQRVCDNLTGTRGYHSAWLVLLDDAGRYVMSAEAGLGKDFQPMVEMLREGEFTTCGRKALSQSGIVAIEDPASTCTDCPLSKKCAGRSAMTIRLEHGKKVYGILSVSIPADFVLSKEEQGLFEEVAGDISFSLHGIEVEEDRRQAEEELKVTRKRLDLAMDAGEHGFWDWNIDTDDIYFSPRYYTMLGYESGELPMRLETWVNLMHPEDREAIVPQVQECVKNSQTYEVEFRLRTKDGGWRWISGRGKSFEMDEQGNSHRALGVHVDITERKQAEEKIKRSLREKEALLAEIHHRVKNNMQIVTSLLSLQSKDIKDERALSLIKNCEDRIKSMSLVHEKLYLSEDLSMIDFHDYMETLAARLFQVHGVDSRVVTFSSQIKDVLFNIETAIPLGLIINELISNAIKHAFPEGRKGNIAVELTQNKKAEEYTLTVTDDGIGLPEEIDYRNMETFGLQLVDMLTEQLHGTMELDRSKGTSFKIVFRELKYKKRM